MLLGSFCFAMTDTDCARLPMYLADTGGSDDVADRDWSRSLPAEVELGMLAASDVDAGTVVASVGYDGREGGGESFQGA